MQWGFVLAWFAASFTGWLAGNTGMLILQTTLPHVIPPLFRAFVHGVNGLVIGACQWVVLAAFFTRTGLRERVPVIGRGSPARTLAAWILVTAAGHAVWGFIYHLILFMQSQPADITSTLAAVDLVYIVEVTLNWLLPALFQAWLLDRWVTSPWRWVAASVGAVLAVMVIRLVLSYQTPIHMTWVWANALASGISALFLFRLFWNRGRRK